MKFHQLGDLGQHFLFKSQVAESQGDEGRVSDPAGVVIKGAGRKMADVVEDVDAVLYGIKGIFEGLVGQGDAASPARLLTPAREFVLFCLADPLTEEMSEFSFRAAVDN